jgi:hypothetical protein
MANMSAFQANDESSILSARTKLIMFCTPLGVFYYGESMTAEFDGFEGNICTGRAALESGGWISETRIPKQCLECLERALEDETAFVIEKDQYLDAVQKLGGLAVVDPEWHSMWRSTTMRVPEEGWTREFEVARGFDDMSGQSYVDGTETEVQSIFLSCDN